MFVGSLPESRRTLHILILIVLCHLHSGKEGYRSWHNLLRTIGKLVMEAWIPSALDGRTDSYMVEVRGSDRWGFSSEVPTSITDNWKHGQGRDLQTFFISAIKVLVPPTVSDLSPMFTDEKILLRWIWRGTAGINVDGEKGSESRVDFEWDDIICHEWDLVLPIIIYWKPERKQCLTILCFLIIPKFLLFLLF